MKAKRVLWFLLGAACFMIAQPLLRIPILQYLQNSTGFTLAYVINPLLIGILIALSAGVFEEGFRFLFKWLLIKPAQCEFSQPILFGLGHGFAEAFYLLVPVLSYAPLSQMGLAFLERGLAITLHTTLTVMVWNGFQRNKQLIYLLAAILIHGGVDALIPIFSSHPNKILLLEGALAVIDIILIVYALYSRRYYIDWRKQNEEVNL